jgi:hypothetical protein
VVGRPRLAPSASLLSAETPRCQQRRQGRLAAQICLDCRTILSCYQLGARWPGSSSSAWLSASAASSRPGAVPLRIERPFRVMTIGRGRPVGVDPDGVAAVAGRPEPVLPVVLALVPHFAMWRDRIFRPSIVRFTEAEKPRRIARWGRREAARPRSTVVSHGVHGQPNLKLVSCNRP